MSKVTLQSLASNNKKIWLRLDHISNSIDKLAELMLKSFESISLEISGRFSNVEERFIRLETDIQDIKLRLDNTAHKFEIKELDKRVAKLERKMDSK